MTGHLPMRATGVGIVGGGRWAHVHASVLRDILPGDGTVAVQVLSPGHPAGWDKVRDWPGWQVAASLTALLADPGISHVIIARKASQHAATALDCLAAGKRVLVEKPAALTLADADRLVQAACGRCTVGHVFAHAGNIARFRAACLSRGAVTGLHLTWGDPATEARHGTHKRVDLSLNVVQDVLPHAWSVLRPFLPAGLAVEVAGAQVAQGGAIVGLDLRCGDTSLRLALSRAHPARQRHLIVTGQDWDGELDFSTEPGQATLDGQAVDVATGFISPMAAQARAFLADAPLQSTQIAAVRDAIALAARSMDLVRAQQAVLLRGGDTRDPAFATALREVLLGGIAADGTGASHDQIAAWAGREAHVLRSTPVDLPS